jgi:hypothetical protein
MCSAFKVCLLVGAVSCGSAWAAHVYFDDGRVCTGCKVTSEQGKLKSVKDKSGNEWVKEETKFIRVVRHPYLLSLFLSTAAGAQQFGQGMTDSANAQMMQRPVTTNCNTYTNMVNCTSY